MFQVTDKAIEVIQEILKDKVEEYVIRILMNEGGCAGPYLGMALDEQREDDEVFKEKGITFLINRDLWEVVKPVTVDYVTSRMGSGFKVSSSLDDTSPCGGGCCQC